MKTSEALKEARALIESGRRRHVCTAIDAALGGNWLAWKKRRLIMNMLEGYETLEIWLNAKHGIPYDAMTPEQMRLYRMRWLDHLIAKYKAKGD